MLEELEKAVEYKMRSQRELAQANVSRLSRMEEEADALRREIALELTKGEIPPRERGDLLQLSRDIDRITDWTRESGRILSVASVERLPEELIKKGLNELCYEENRNRCSRLCLSPDQATERSNEAS